MCLNTNERVFQIHHLTNLSLVLVNCTTEPGGRVGNECAVTHLYYNFSLSGSSFAGASLWCRSPGLCPLWLSRYQSDSSGFHLPPPKVSFVHLPALCQCDIVSDMTKTPMCLCILTSSSFLVSFVENNDPFSGGRNLWNGFLRTTLAYQFVWNTRPE